MAYSELEQLTFIIARELGVEKSDVELLKSIREDKNAYHSALRQIPREEKCATKIVHNLL